MVYGGGCDIYGLRVVKHVVPQGLKLWDPRHILQNADGVAPNYTALLELVPP